MLRRQRRMPLANRIQEGSVSSLLFTPFFIQPIYIYIYIYIYNVDFWSWTNSNTFICYSEFHASHEAIIRQLTTITVTYKDIQI